MVAQTEAESGERCAGLVHIFIIYGLGLAVCTLGRDEVASLCVVDVLGLAYGSEHVDVESRRELELQSSLDAIEFFLDTGHRHVRE